jgi:WD40 repeat protein
MDGRFGNVCMTLCLSRIVRLFTALVLLALSLAAPAETTAAWSPDGKTVALVLTDLRQTRQWISLWDAASSSRTGTDIKAPAGARFTNPAFSHDGRLLAVGRTRGSDGLVMQVFDAGFGGQQLQFAGKEASAEALGFSSDDSLILLRLASGSVIAVAMGTGEQRTAFGHAERAALSPDGRWLGLINAGQIHVLDLNGQQDPLALAAPGATRLAFNQEGQALTALTATGVTSWTLPGGKELFRQALSPAPSSSADAGVIYSSDRRSLLARSGDKLYVLDRDTGTSRKVIEGIEPGPVLLSDPIKRERVLAGGGRRLPIFWNAYFGGHQPFSLDSPIYTGAALSQDGQWLAAGMSSTLGEIGMLRVVKPASREHFDLPGATRSVGFAGPGLLAADDGRGRVLFWSLASRQLQGRIDAYCLDGESRLLGASEAAGTVLLRCDKADGSTVSELRNTKGLVLKRWPDPAIGLSASGQRVAFAGDGGLDMFYLQTGVHQKLRAPEPFRADRVAFSGDENRVISIDGQTGLVFFFSQDDTHSYLSLSTGYTGATSAELMWPDMRQFVAVGDGGLQSNPLPIRHWDLTGDRRSFNEYSGGHTGRVVSLLLLPGTNRFVSASADNTLRVWELDGRSQVLLAEPGNSGNN